MISYEGGSVNCAELYRQDTSASSTALLCNQDRFPGLLKQQSSLEQTSPPTTSQVNRHNMHLVLRITLRPWARLHALDPKPCIIGTELRSDLRDAYEEGVRTGDVGLIGKSGDSKSIFNISRPRAGPINSPIFGAPPGF
ncbi:hypothetical protein D9758_007548 [Tetrapyrgos nigripes]|uniref:Uncharacterized protein n=1 Tax=Tetrapyrgos nigripes TaxID=182062 RepID=A0A8H5G831_9AGAR|nr:hypothetical protein D9758_007548 [Tetrapyrgos nigripes]